MIQFDIRFRKIFLVVQWKIDFKIVSGEGGRSVARLQYFQVRDDESLDCGCGGSGEQQLRFGVILQVEVIGFVVGVWDV